MVHNPIYLPNVVSTNISKPQPIWKPYSLPVGSLYPLDKICRHYNPCVGEPGHIPLREGGGWTYYKTEFGKSLIAYPPRGFGVHVVESTSHMKRVAF